MSAPDPFARDDAAYVLGVLPDADRAAFEVHLAGCAECRTRVAELREVPRWFGVVSAGDLAPDYGPRQERPPDTLLPGLLRAASARRRRARAVVAGLTAVAAACVAILIVALRPSQSTPPAAPTATSRFVALVSAPVSAAATLTAKQWGTEIDLRCVYSAAVGEHPVRYFMYAYGRHGDRVPAGSWNQLPEVTYVGGASLALQDISKIEIVLPDGTPILRLTR